MRVLLADDQARVRWALRTFLQEKADLTLVGETSRAESLLAMVKATCPDLLLLDWELPGRPIIELLSALKMVDHHLKIIVLSSQPEAQRAALAAGVAGFVSKNDPPEQLLITLQAL